MTLTPIKVETIFKSADPEFNHKAARAAYEMVMKMDVDEARVFTEIVVADAVEEIIEKNLRTVQNRVDEIVAKRIADVKRAVVSKSAGNPDAVPFAQALAVIEKAASDRIWRESDYRRDGGGRFATKVSRSQTKAINERTAASLGIKPHPNGLKGQQLAQYQDEYRQLAAFLGSVHASSVQPGDSDVYLHFRDKKTGEAYTDKISGTTRAKPTMLDPKERDLVGMEARPNTLTMGGAAFGLTGALSGQGVQNVNAMTDSNRMRSFADDWVAQDAKNSNARTYSRIKGGSEYLGAVAPAGSKLQMATAFGEFVGSMGPEAERVIGPTARKTAYRYRGTEKTPDKRLVGVYGRAISGAKTRSAYDPQRAQADADVRGARRDALEGKEPRRTAKPPVAPAPSQMAARRKVDDERAPTWDERDDGRKVVRAYLEGKLPDRNLYGLQLASGNTPPSQGIMLNKDGQIATEAVGYGDDHYLPFNLKNLKALKGGEYVRTRSVGGLTSEDIYTGLIGGAKQVSVVSRSGQFTVTFADDFRGGRRHNDKARRMTRRYEQILDAVQSEQIDKPGNIDPRIREIITQQVEMELGAYSNPREKRDLVKTRINEYKNDADLAPEDEILINTLARAALRDGTTRDEKEYRRQITGEIMADKQTRYRLDGDGYRVALLALEEQFPYYITVKSVVKDEGEVQSIERDRGYVEPSRNRPTEAAAGLFGPTHRGEFAGRGGKFSASEADYQGGGRPRQIGGGTITPVSPEGGPVPPTPVRAPEADDVPKENVDTKTPPTGFVFAATSLVPVISEKVAVSEGDQRVLNYTADDLMDPAKAAAFDEVVTRQAQAKTPDGKPVDLGPAYLEYQQAKGAFGKRPYEKALRGMFGSNTYAFSGPAYETDKVEDKRRELDRIDTKVPSSIYSTKRISRMTENELAREHSGLLKIYQAAQVAGSDPQARKAAFESVGADPEAPATKMLIANKNPAVAGKFLDNIHRVHAVKKGVSEDALFPPTNTTIHSGDGTPKPAEPTYGRFESSLLRYAADKAAERGDYDKERDLLEAAEDFHEVPQMNITGVQSHHQDLLKEATTSVGKEFYDNVWSKKTDAESNA